MRDDKGKDAEAFSGLSIAHVASAPVVHAQPVQAHPAPSYSVPPQYGAPVSAYGAPPSYGAQPVQQHQIPQYEPSYSAPPTYLQPISNVPLSNNSYGAPPTNLQPMPVPISNLPLSNNNATHRPMNFAAVVGNRSEAAKKREFQSRMCMPCCLIFFALVFLISGASLSAAMEEELDEAKALEPEKDFQDLGLSCKTARIFEKSQNVEVCVDEGQDSCRRYETTCEDIYQLYITWEGDSNVSSEYFVDEVYAMRPGAYKVCSENAPKDLEWNIKNWVVGQDLRCWKPTDEETMAEDMHDAYHCPNDECLKINDPADDVDDHIERIKILITVSGVIMLLGILMFVIAACCCCRVCVGKRY